MGSLAIELGGFQPVQPGQPWPRSAESRPHSGLGLLGPGGSSWRDRSFGGVGLRYRPPAIILLQPTCASVPLQRHAKVVGSHLHPELPAKMFPDLLGRGLVAECLDGAQGRIAQR